MNLEKEFIPYNLALALKELGFDEPCFGWFILEGDGAKSMFVPEKCPKQDIGLCLAPTFSQAFRWFREKHHLIGTIEYIGGATPKTTWWDIFVIGHFNIDPSEWTMKYQPYEEAELACVVKLIDIVKNK